MLVIQEEDTCFLSSISGIGCRVQTLWQEGSLKTVFCRRLQAKAGDQKMADLPLDRITPDLPPFTHVGVDYFGPIEVKRGRAHVKRWGVIFTCLVTRAVHLEVASFLNTDACINAIRRFICRRGSIKSIRSDQGTNFIGAQRELAESMKLLDNGQIQRALLKEGIDWTFNPPSGPHHGGVWERLIRLVKKILYSILKEQTLDDEALQTAFCEVEAIMNDRPITTVTNDPNDLEPLTPNHLLQLKTFPTLPPRTVPERGPILTQEVETGSIPGRPVLETMDQGICSTYAGKAQME